MPLFTFVEFSSVGTRGPVNARENVRVPPGPMALTVAVKRLARSRTLRWEPGATTVGLLPPKSHSSRST